MCHIFEFNVIFEILFIKQSFYIRLQIVEGLTAIYSIFCQAVCYVMIYGLLKGAASNAEFRVKMKG